MSGFLAIDVIKQVKIRPGIYNKDSLPQPRKEQRQQLWLEVAENVTPKDEWALYTKAQKEARVCQVTNKWKNLRDHFYREIKLIEAGLAHKKRKYIYFDDMEFVRPYIGYKLPSTNKRVNKTVTSTDTTQYSALDDTDIDMDAFLKLNDKIDKKQKRKVISDGGRYKKMSKTVPAKKSTIARQKNNPSSNSATTSRSENDDVIQDFNVLQKIDGTKNPSFKISESDLSFCLSLVPTLRELSGTRKLSAKIDILKVLHKHMDSLERINDQDRENEHMMGELLEDNADPLNDDKDNKDWRK